MILNGTFLHPQGSWDCVLSVKAAGYDHYVCLPISIVPENLRFHGQLIYIELARLADGSLGNPKITERLPDPAPPPLDPDLEAWLNA